MAVRTSFTSAVHLNSHVQVFVCTLGQVSAAKDAQHMDWAKKLLVFQEPVDYEVKEPAQSTINFGGGELQQFCCVQFTLFT